jgi:hypothetical protein
MADQGVLDTQWDRIIQKLYWTGEDGTGGINGHSVANLLWWGPAGVRAEVIASIAAPILDALKNRTEGSQSVFDEIRYAHAETMSAIAALTVKVDAVAAALDHWTKGNPATIASKGV